MSFMIDRFLGDLQAKTPKDAVLTWMKGVITRNGAIQYASLSPSLQKQTYKDYEEIIGELVVPVHGWKTEKL